MTIFLSHTTRDKALVRDFVRRFPAHLSVWLDEREIQAGQGVHDAVVNAVRSCTFLIPFISESSRTSQWVQLELEEAIKIETLSKLTTILPVIIPPLAGPLPPSIQDRRYVTLHSPSDRDMNSAAREILDAILHWTIYADPIAGAPTQTLSNLAAAAAKHVDDSFHAGLLAKDALARIQRAFKAIVRTSVLGESSEHLPPDWIRECAKVASLNVQFRHPEAIAEGDTILKPIEQSFLVGYYCTRARPSAEDAEANPKTPLEGAVLSGIARRIVDEVNAGQVPDGWVLAYEVAKIIVRPLAKHVSDDPVMQKVLLQAAWQGTVYALAEERCIQSGRALAAQTPQSQHETSAQATAVGADSTRETAAHHKTAGLKVFVSYSRQDVRWLKRLQVHLKPLIRDGTIDLWDDTRVAAGDEWRDKVNIALSNAAVAVLLISADFMASDSITQNELPPLLERASTGGLRIMPVIVGPCHVQQHESLSKYQAVNSPRQPLTKMAKPAAEETLARIARIIAEHVRP